MVCLREIPRTATFAWSPGTTSQYLATGTKAGAVDEGFSNDTQLELWDLELGSVNKSLGIKPAASISTDSRFNDIAWTINESNNSRSVIAGALESGSLDLWDSEVLLGGQSDALMSRTSKHSGSIKALQFNAFRSELLATVGAKGELFISDLNNVGKPFRMGNAVARADDFECLDWNKRTSHIMVTGSSGGTMTVWDIKNKRESLTLNNMGRKVVSAVAWDPVKTTRLATAIPHDTEPVILVWDLRNANAPEKILKGHDGGVLSLSWCKQDSNLLLSSGKDNRNLCWNPQTGEAYGEFPVVTNWTFQTRWNPHNPNFMATASFDGRIVVQSIQSTKSEVDIPNANQSQTLDDEDFFNKAQSQPQGTAFTLTKAPKWLQRPCGTTFSFGGKIVSFKPTGLEPNKRSIVRISTYAIDDSIVSATNLFETSLNKTDLSSICDARIAAATDVADEADWSVIKILTSKDTRKDLIGYLGISNHNKSVDETSDLSISGGKKDDSKLKSNDEEAAASKTNRLSAFFDNSADGDNFLSELAATRGVKVNNPFQLYDGSESEPDRAVTRALLLGEFEKALDVCLHEQRMSDAFMIAVCGGQICIEKAQKAYFDQKERSPNYLRLLASIVGKNLWDLVHNADLESWKEVMTSLCTYGDVEEFPDLCEALGDRLEEQLQDSDDSKKHRKAAAFCYLAGSKLEKVVSIWISELQEKEQKSLEHEAEGSAFSIHARSLQSFIEKVTVFRQVTNYRDDQRDSASDWKLSALYDRYIEYADIASAHGQLEVAGRYLDLLPIQYAAANVAKDRIKNSAQKAILQYGSRQPTAGNRVPQTTNQGTIDFQQEQTSRPIRNISNPSNPYAPVAASIPQAQNPYAPANAQYGQRAYTNDRNQQQQQPPPQPGMPLGSQYQNDPHGPPRSFNASPSIAPPSKAANIGNWNDMPESFFKPPSMSRRGTPVVPVNGGHHYQQSVPFPNQSIGPPPKPTPSVGPPPKANAGPPRLASPPADGPQLFQQAERPPSTTNSYAPSRPSLPKQPLGTVPRGPSPYNAPPSAPPPSNRYAPSQPALVTQPGSIAQTEPTRTPSNTTQAPPPANSYGPQQIYKLGHQGTPPIQQPPPSTRPPQGSAAPPSVSPPISPQGSTSNTRPSQRKGIPSKHCE